MRIKSAPTGRFCVFALLAACLPLAVHAETPYDPRYDDSPFAATPHQVALASDYAPTASSFTEPGYAFAIPVDYGSVDPYQNSLSYEGPTPIYDWYYDCATVYPRTSRWQHEFAAFVEIGGDTSTDLPPLASSF